MTDPIPLDPTFLRPIAHRGYHTMRGSTGVQHRVENGTAAFVAAIERGYGIECDVQPSRDGIAIVHHDETLERLTGQTDRVDRLTAAEITRLTYGDPTGSAAEHPITLVDLLALVAGRVPLFVEIKSAWQPHPASYLDHIAAVARAYRGNLALMSFDPVVMVALRARAPEIPRGIIAGIYEPVIGDGWWSDRLPPERRYRLSHLLENHAVAPSFVSYHVSALPTPVTRYVREVQRLPLLAWTVRTAAERSTALAHADAATFEGYEA